METAHPPRKRRILFMAEAVTLAHVSRPAVLAQSLDPHQYEILFAADSRYDGLFPNFPLRRRQIFSIPSQQFLAALAAGSPVYSADTLRKYVQEDLAVIDQFKPDLIVGDFRLSLSVSARLAGIPYAAITNAYWSPYSRTKFPMPELPMTRYLGYPLSRTLFRLARPLAFALHCRPLNRVRREHGLPSLGYDLRRVYTDADFVLYADVAELVPTYDRPPNHFYIGPILWAPETAEHTSFTEIAGGRPIIYVTLGSSGNATLLPQILTALADTPNFIVAATAGRLTVPNVPQNAYLAEFVSGTQVAAAASVVICNGGSPTTYQALAAGTPVLGIPSNLDQFLNMECVVGAGVGEVLAARNAQPSAIRAKVESLIRSPKGKLQDIAEAIRKCLATQQFSENLPRFAHTPS